MDRRARATKTKDKTAAVEETIGLDACGKLERKRNVSSNGVPCSVLHDAISVGEAYSDNKIDATGSEEEEEEAAFCEEGVKKKMGVLARMVGMEGCGQPGVVLTEVVRVLKELDGRARGVCSSRK
ncbi:uncharacterized protein LOC110038302 [Phalaenopsis equestris]|uniref:uncharacterized protein LOC110038302 n=1 Tax=Phalaenopsis equestris TaxID=78828 RepID=UPI0009E5E6E7|nr:uncharacterized protein LOC110038302 [Phalaenopsis equestris]